MGDGKSPFSLLLVDDEPKVISSLKRLLNKDFKLLEAASAREAMRVLDEEQVDCAIIDYKMPGMDGLTLLGEMKKLHPFVAVVMLTGHGGIPEAVEAIQRGALDFIEKGAAPERILASLNSAKRLWELERENSALKERLKGHTGLEAIIGESGPVRRVKHLIRQLGATEINVLITGESGTGKELAARALHLASPRAEKAFVPVDCAAISESLIESELFGHKKGAYTGAHSSTVGLIRSAEGGTLFLDEIGELPLKAQVKLLRTIQEKTVRPIGGETLHQIDVRIIAATNRNLEDEVKNGEFREDLYYRLNVANLVMPPLRERVSDISLLAGFFLGKYNLKDNLIKSFTAGAMRCLEEYNWPGNVRELENAVNRSIALSKTELIDIPDLPETVTGRSNAQVVGSYPPEGSSMEDYEKAAILNALNLSHGDKAEAAEILGIGLSTLYRKFSKYSIEQ